MITMAAQITSLMIVYATVYPGAYQKISKLSVTGLCTENSPVTGEFPAQKASNAENVSIWWRHHVLNASSGVYHLVYSIVCYLQLLPRCLQSVWLPCKLFANLIWLTLAGSWVTQSRIRVWVLVPTVKIDCQISVGNIKSFAGKKTERSVSER